MKKTEEYADGIYLTVSGRKFYRIGTTHIIPVLHDEIHAITQKVTHRKASFGKVTKKIDGIAPEDLEMFEMDLSSNSVDTEKEETKKDDDDISKTSLRVHTPSPSNTLELQDTVL